MTEFAQQIVNGLGTGSEYALWAVGYGLVFQVLGLMHFAHGDTLLIGLYIAWSLLVTLSFPIWIAFCLVIAAGGLLAAVVERGVYRPLVKRNNPMAAFSAALGAAYILRNIATLGWGHDAKIFPRTLEGSSIHVGGAVFNTVPIIALAVTLTVVGVFTLFLRRHRMGQAIVMVAQDRTTAALMGIPVYRVISLVYVLSGMIGMIGALLYVGQFGALDPLVGLDITLKAFVAALIGGLGRLGGAVLGGLLLGVMEALVIGYVSSLYSDAVVFGVLAIIIVARPQGLLGRVEEVKL
jgi:branched-chain amino acid transport system permease protein